MLNQILLGDCYELMKGIPDGSVDLILTDPPYNTTALSWDQRPTDLATLWDEIKRITKPNAAIVFTASQPFTTDLINSNRKWFRYCWVWDKVNRFTGALNVNRMPMKVHEDIVIFYKSQPTYNKQMVIKPRVTGGPRLGHGAHTQYGKYGKPTPGASRLDGKEHNPGSIISFPGCSAEINGTHPTQKPAALFEYLIKTYSNPDETILDPFAGSGTTALAAHATGRQFICIEKERKYWEIANKRLALAQMQGRFEEMVG
jgi:site-specific DNA-methyltransferase (adenine-specific)